MAYELYNVPWFQIKFPSVKWHLSEKTGQKAHVTGRQFTFNFTQYKSYPKRLLIITFAEVAIFSGYHHIMMWTKMAEISGNFRWA